MSISITIPPRPVAGYAAPGTPVRSQLQSTRKGLKPLAESTNSLVASKVAPACVCDSFLPIEAGLRASAALQAEGYHYRFPTPWRLHWPAASTRANLYFHIRRTQLANFGAWTFNVDLNGDTVVAEREVRGGATGSGWWQAAEDLELDDTLTWQNLRVYVVDDALGEDNYCLGISLLPQLPTSVPVIGGTGWREGLRPAPVGQLIDYAAAYTGALKAIGDDLIEVYRERQPTYVTSARLVTDFRDGDPNQFVVQRNGIIRPTLPADVSGLEYHVRARQVSGSGGGKVGVQGDGFVAQEITPGAGYSWHRFELAIANARPGLRPSIYLTAASVNVSALSVWAQRGGY